MDFPEATLQRNVYGFAWIIRHPELSTEFSSDILKNAIMAGLNFTARIQRSDGSFDQAFPNEHSFGATAFLILPLLESFQAVSEEIGGESQNKIIRCLEKAANFLCKNSEIHAHIANHLAGAAAALLACANFFNKTVYEKRALDLLESILSNQSAEGWFLEYDGADPGYQTLCLYYLAKIYCVKRDKKLHDALQRAIEFVSYFAHPDGTFGGEYGSRRTTVFYPGGIALLSEEFPAARATLHHMLDAISEGRTVTLDDIDMGNMSPLLENYCAALDFSGSSSDDDYPSMPCQREAVRQDFPQAGLAIRSNTRYYAIAGISNGGTLKVFDKNSRNNSYDDTGYVGRTNRGDYITTQVTDLKKQHILAEDKIVIQAPFYKMSRATPTPFSFFIFRLFNLTFMHNQKLRNSIKKILAGLLIRSKRAAPLHLERTVMFNKENITINDRLRGKLSLLWLECGQPFVSVHMASARYFEGSGSVWRKARQTPVQSFQTDGEIHQQVTIWPDS